MTSSPLVQSSPFAITLSPLEVGPMNEISSSCPPMNRATAFRVSAICSNSSSYCRASLEARSIESRIASATHRGNGASAA